jgi:hypothetical protein
MEYNLNDKLTKDDLKKEMLIIVPHYVYGTLYGFYYRKIYRIYKYKIKCVDGYELSHFDNYYKFTDENKKIVDEFNLNQLIDQRLRSFDFTKLDCEIKRSIYNIIMSEVENDEK